MTSRPECCSTEFRRGLWLGQAGSVGSYSRTGFCGHYEDNFGWPCLAYWQLAATWRTQRVTCTVLMSVPSPEPHDGRASRVQIQVQMREPFWNSGGYGLSLVVMSGQCLHRQSEPLVAPCHSSGKSSDPEIAPHSCSHFGQAVRKGFVALLSRMLLQRLR